jgi:hypothetical protein
VPSVLSAVARGVTQRDAVALIRSLGQPFSGRNPWGRLLSYARDAAVYNTRLRSIGNARKPNVERIPFSLGEQRRKFSWTVRINLVDENGDRYEQFLTASTDNANLTVQQIKDAAMRAYESGSGDPDMEVLSTVIVGGTRRYDT